MQKNIDERDRFAERVKQQRRATRIRVFIIAGIILVLILIVIVWASIKGYYS